MPLPIIDAISLRDRRTEAGPVGALSRATLVCVDVRAFGVGAPTAVAAEGGSAVRRGASQREAACRIGSRNHQTASAPIRATPSNARRRSPLRQPFTVSHVIHRTSRLE